MRRKKVSLTLSTSEHAMLLRLAELEGGLRKPLISNQI